MRKLLYGLYLVFACSVYYVVDAASANCVQYSTQATCSTNALCSWNVSSNVCNPLCSAVLAPDCVQTVGCSLNYSSAAPQQCLQINSSDTCNYVATSAACTSSAACTWDPYTLICFTVLSQINAVFPCAYFNTGAFGGSSTACTFHGCSVDSSGSNCIANGTSTSVVSTPVQVVNYSVTWLPPAGMLDSYYFAGNITVPLSLSVATPSWYIFGFGLASAFNVATTLLTTPNQCNSANASAVNGPVPLYYSGTIPKLTSYYLNWVRTNHSYKWNTSVEEGAVLSRLFAGTTGFQYVDVSADGSTIIYMFNRSTVLLVDVCNTTLQATSNYVGTIVSYNMPMTMVYQQYQPQYGRSTTLVQSSNWMFWYNTTSITPQIVAGVSYTRPSIVVMDELNTLGACSTGSQQQLTTVVIMYTNRNDPNVIVGPRYTTDIFTTVSTTGLINCYGDTAINVTLLGCSATTCSTQVVFASRCRNVTSDGLAFTSCAYASASDRVSDLGNSAGVYNTSLNLLRGFQLQAYVCPVARTNDTACYMANANGPDQLSFQTAQTIVPTPAAPSAFGSFAINYATLPASSSVLPVQGFHTILSPGVNTTAVGSGVTLRGVGNQITIALWLNNTYALTQHTMRVLTFPGNLTLTPIDTFGNVRAGQPVIDWSQMAYLATYAPRVAQAAIPTLQLLPACVGSSGCDGFSFPVTALASISPGQSYRIGVTYMITVRPPLSYTGVTRRRLLEHMIATRQCEDDDYQPPTMQTQKRVRHQNSIQFDVHW